MDNRQHAQKQEPRMNELFPVEVSLSPKLKWLDKNGLETQHYPEAHGIDEDEFGNDVFEWVCRKKLPEGFHITERTTWSPNSIGGGETEEDAICDYCQNSGTPHYNA